MTVARSATDKRNRDRTAEKRIASVRSNKNAVTMDDYRNIPVDKPLTDKQKKFVWHVANGESTSNAIRMAGFAESNTAVTSYGVRLLAQPNIQALLKQYQQQLQEKTMISRQKVVDMHLEAFEMAKLMAEPSTMVAAAREIGKMHGYYEPKKVEITLNGAVQTKKLEQLTTQELEEMIQKAQTGELGSPKLIEQVTGDSDGDES